MKRLSLHAFFAALALLMAGCVLFVGCEKDPSQSSNDASSNAGTEASSYCVFGGDSSAVGMVVVMRDPYADGVMDWTFKVGDSRMLYLYTTRDLQAGGTYPFVAESGAYGGANGVYVAMADMYGEVEFAQGTLEVTVVAGKPEFVVNATSEDGRSLRLRYKGEVHDLCHPLGSGWCSYGDERVGIDIAYSQFYYGLYEYAFSDTMSSYGVTFYSVAPLASGTYAVSNDMEAVDRGEALDLYLYIEDGDNVLEGDVANGSATCTVNGSQISITFGGDLDGTPISGSYSGRLERLAE